MGPQQPNVGVLAREVYSTLSQMESAIRKGDFLHAAEVGNRLQIPLAVSLPDLGVQSTLSSGQQSTVSRCTWKGQPVAVKRARITTSNDLERFRSEIRLLATLGQHANIVPLLAARALPPDYMLVMPLQTGNLADKLHGQGWLPEWSTVLEVALQIAEGLDHIHACGILHRDLKAANILEGPDGCVRITDFGIADFEAALASDQADRNSLVGRGAPSGGFHKRHMVGTLEYMSPEVLQKQPYSFAADVYAWAVTVNEIATGVVPFSDCTKDNPQCHTVLNFGYGRQELAAAVAAEGLRPLTAASTPPALLELLKSCWQLNPDIRPSAAQLKHALRAMLQSGSPVGLAIGRETSATAVPSSNGVAAANGKTAVLTPPETSGVQEQGRGFPRISAAQQAGSGYQPEVRAGSFETAGLRGADQMEDRHMLVSPLGPEEPHTHLLGIFDGHRGAQTAEYAASSLLAHLRECWGQREPEQALKASFISLDTAYREAEERQWQQRLGRMGAAAGRRAWPGCTAIAALILHDRIFIANAGDCRAVLCHRGKAVQLSRDLTAEDAEERARVQLAGGKLRQVMSSWRVGDAGIQVTRSLGDGDMKGSGLIAEPEVTARSLAAEDDFLIMASDGLWDRLQNQEAVDLVHDTVKEPDMCAKRLATEALTRGSDDNITVVIAFLRPVETLEQIYSQGKHKHRGSSSVLRMQQRVSADELQDTY